MHSGIAVTPDGTVYCAHPEGGSLLELPADGPARLIETDLAELHGIATTPRRGVLAVADPGYRMTQRAHDRYDETWTPGRAVLVEAATGRPLLELDDPTASEAGTRWRPTSIAIRADGEIWVADGYGLSLVHRFDAEGRHLATFDGATSGLRFDCPHGIMLRTAADWIEVLVADRANRRIVILDVDGGVLEVFGSDHLDSPSAMAELDGDLFVTELHGGLARFDRKNRFVGVVERGRVRDPEEPGWPNTPGEATGSLQAPPLSPGCFNSPHGITAHDGHLYLTEWLIGGRLVRLRPR